jgi:hypothetical protein
MRAADQQHAGDTYTAMLTVLHYEHNRFVRKVQAWMGTALQTP